MRELVILDLDGTIIKGQSQLLFLNYLFKKKVIGLFFYLKIYFWFLLYNIGIINNPKNIMIFAFSFLRDKKSSQIEDLVNNFFNEVLKKFIFSEMVGIINEHISKNRELLIISNAADIIVKKVAEFLNINNYIGTKLETKNRIFTGDILGDIIYGKNKANYVKGFIRENNLNFKNSWAYADHVSDLDLLLLVANPYAINPDKLLFREAKKRSWPILKFKT